MAINTKKRQDLKSYFVKNAIPTEGNFAELIDAQLNQADDGVFKLAGEPLSVVATPGDQQRALRLYATYPAANPDWFISLKPAQTPSNPATTRAGFGVTDGAGNTRLFIDASTGNLGVGTNNPADKLNINGGDLRIDGGRYRRIKVISDSYWAGIELVTRNQGEAGRPHIDFTHGDLDNPNYGMRLSAESNTKLILDALTGDATFSVLGNITASALATANGGVNIGDGNLSAHVEKDGAFYRANGQAHITVDDNLYIRDLGAATNAFAFQTDTGALTMAGKLKSASTETGAILATGAITATGQAISAASLAATGLVSAGSVAVGAASTTYTLDVTVPGTSGIWNRFVVTGENQWGDGANYVTIGAGGAAGIMLSNPHVSWRDSRAAIRYGRTGGAPGKTWWEAGVQADGRFAFSANDDGGAGEKVSISKAGVLATNAIVATGAITATNQAISSGSVSTGTLTTTGAITATDQIISGGSLYVSSNKALHTLDQTSLIRFGQFVSGVDYQMLHKVSGMWSRPTLGIHTHTDHAFGIYSTGWTGLFGVQGGTGNAFTLGNLDAAGVWVERSVAAHLDKDGAFYRYSGQVYITVDDNLYIRDSGGGDAIPIAFQTNTGSLTLIGKLTAGSATINGAPLSYNGDNYFVWNGAADVNMRYLGRGAGGRAIVHDDGNKLTLNYGGDFAKCRIYNYEAASSRDYKDDIRELGLDEALKLVAGLNPASFHWKNAPDGEQTFGFIAEDAPEPVRSSDGKAIDTLPIIAALTRAVQSLLLERAERAPA